MKTKLFLLIVALIILIAGFSGITAQETVDINALRTEIASTVYAEVYATVSAQFAAASTQAAANQQQAVTQSVVIGDGLIKPTPVMYAHMAKLVKQDKNYKQYKMYEDWDVTWTFKNVGLQDWTNEFYLRHYKGEVPIQGKVIFFPAVKKGETANIYVRFDGKTAPGIYNSYWELINNDGHVILDNIFVAILVK